MFYILVQPTTSNVVCKHVTWLLCTYRYLDLPALQLDTEHFNDLNDNLNKMAWFSPKCFGKFHFLICFFSWPEIKWLFQTFSDRRNPVYLSCAKWSRTDQRLASLQSQKSSSASIFSFTCTDLRQVTGTCWGRHDHNYPAVWSQCRWRRDGRQTRGITLLQLNSILTHAHLSFPSLKTAHLFLTSLL